MNANRRSPPTTPGADAALRRSPPLPVAAPGDVPPTGMAAAPAASLPVAEVAVDWRWGCESAHPLTWLPEAPPRASRARPGVR